VASQRIDYRPTSKIALGLVALGLALATVMPSYAEGASTAPTGLSGGFVAGPNSSGGSTYIGMVEAPRANARIAGGANLLVTGWAADTTASGWSGFDQIQVYNGDRAKGGTKVADGSVGLNRPDVADGLGGAFMRTGFSAVVPANAVPVGPATLYVYLHTADKGWWYKTVPVTQSETVALQYPADPVVTILHPTDGEIITDRQFGATAEAVISGFALDRNPQTNPNGTPKTNSPFGGPGNVGIQSVTLYIDKLPGDPGYNADVNMLGGQSGGPASPSILTLGNPDSPVANTYFSNSGCRYFGFPSRFCTSEFSVTKSFGPDYTFAGWVSFWNQRTVQTEMWHTIYAVARSSITGKSSTAQTSVYVKSYPSNSPPCAISQFLKHKCAIVTG
jgi:hypothetical protein